MRRMLIIILSVLVVSSFTATAVFAALHFPGSVDIVGGSLKAVGDLVGGPDLTGETVQVILEAEGTCDGDAFDEDETVSITVGKGSTPFEVAVDAPCSSGDESWTEATLTLKQGDTVLDEQEYECSGAADSCRRITE